jgi:hypothetical protein
MGSRVVVRSWPAWSGGRAQVRADELNGDRHALADRRRGARGRGRVGSGGELAGAGPGGALGQVAGAARAAAELERRPVASSAAPAVAAPAEHDWPPR